MTLGRDVDSGSCVQVSYSACGQASCGTFRCSDGEWVCTDSADCVAESTFAHDACAPAGCESRTLGREVEHGSYVQVSYGGCGRSRCGWYRCEDGDWGCAIPDGAGPDVFGNAECEDVCEAQTFCSGCAAQPGCAWCVEDDRCVDDASTCAAPVVESSACDTCAGSGEVCQVDAQCCDSTGTGAMRCILGFCADTSACSMQTASCTLTTDCCGAIYCSASRSGGSTCCVRAADPCESDAECCGDMTCDDGHCTCREVGESCADHIDCCGGAFCGDTGVCGFT